MIISYLADIGLTKLVFEDDAANLLDLIRLCLRTNRLQIQNFFDVWPCEYEMISADALSESKPLQKTA